MHKVTVYSNWENAKEYEFETLEEAYHFAEEMRHQQYRVIIDLEEVEEDKVRYTMPTAWSPGGIQPGVKLTYPTKE